MSRCPICGKPAGPKAENSSAPFCSERCKLLDLGKWLGEQYRVPVAPREDERSPEPELPEDEGEEGP
jgi:endogenous inhibitor of DNA gyrase (YacG/DUF329 family)